MKPGKLPPELLSRLLAALPGGDPRVVIGPQVGEDAAAIEFGDRFLVVGADPITFATDLIGWYAVNVNANDLACLGAEPRWFLATVLLPPSASEEDAAAVFAQIGEACEKLGVTPVGGHAEITRGIDRPLVMGCMLGEVSSEGLLSKSNAQPGDELFLSAGLAIEGTALLAREMGEELLRRGVAESTLTRARQFLFDPGLSVVPAARRARLLGGVTALHDPTEGGLATGLAELALAAEVGLEIEAIPVLPETQEVCQALRLDPLGLIASGALLMSVRPDRADEFFLTWQERGGIELFRLGRLLSPGEGSWLFDAEGRRRPLPTFDRDELARFFEP